MSSIPFGAIPVLDKGYVLLIGGTYNYEYTPCGKLLAYTIGEARSVDDARVSVGGVAKVMDDGNMRTLRYLLDKAHTSPFRGQVLTVEIKAPLMVAQQIKTYLVGHDHYPTPPSRDPFYSWNQSSERYIEEDKEFYMPQEWRGRPKYRSQGSLGTLDNSGDITARYEEFVSICLSNYREMIKIGMCAEMARGWIPTAFLYTRWRWTMSLQGACWFLKQRLPKDAQQETRLFAEALKEIAVPLAPNIIEHLSGMGAPKK